jgi:sugar lactone lactonase YvrE
VSTLPPHAAGDPGDVPRVQAPPVDLGIPGRADPNQVGRGGSGAVYRARQPGLNRVVAVKVLSTVLDQPGRDRFDREAYAMGTVAGHPNIVQVFTTGTTDTGRPYLVMPFVDGGSLADRLPVPWQYAVHYTVRLSAALETAHRAGVLHRDVKPSNVLISQFGEPLLADFGIARVSGGFETSEGLISASIPYAAPEILEGRPATPAADVYSLAATAFCAIAGSPPFAAGKDEAMVSLYLRISREPVPDLRGLGVPDAVCRVLESALAKDPAQRQQGAALFGRQLQEAQRLTGQPVTPMAVTDEVDRTTMATPLDALRHAASPTVLGAAHYPLTAAGVAVLPDGSLPADPAVRPRRPRGWMVIAAVAVLVIAAGVVGTIAWWPEKAPPAVPGTPHSLLGLDEPTDLAIGSDGSLYIADRGLDKVLRVTSTGAVETVAGTGESGDSGDGRAAAAAELDDPSALALGTDGSIYVASGGRIRRIDAQGLMRPVTGFEDYLSVTALAVGADGSLYVGVNNSVLVRNSSGTVTTFAGGFASVDDLLMRSDGTLLVADSSKAQVYALGSGALSRTVIAGSEDPKASDGDSFLPTETKLSGPTSLAIDPQGRLYIAESSANRVRRVQEDGTMLTIAGNPDGYSSGNDGDGDDAIEATFDLQSGPLAVDGNGLLYIADTGNHRIRTVDAAGIVQAWG